MKTKLQRTDIYFSDTEASQGRGLLPFNPRWWWWWWWWTPSESELHMRLLPYLTVIFKRRLNVQQLASHHAQNRRPFSVLQIKQNWHL